MELVTIKGKLHRCVDGEFLECLPSGYLKDQRTKHHIVHYNRIYNKPSKKEYAQTTIAIAKKMLECFGYKKWMSNINTPDLEIVGPDGHTHRKPLKRRSKPVFKRRVK